MGVPISIGLTMLYITVLTLNCIKVIRDWSLCVWIDQTVFVVELDVATTCQG